MKLWERSTGNLLKNLEGHTNYVNSVAFSPDGAFIVSVSSVETVELCERSTGTLLKTFEGHINGLRSLAFYKDCVFIGSGFNYKTVKLWQSSTRNLLKTIEGHTDSVSVNSVAFSPWCTFIVSNSDDYTV